jgi:Tfp pilus assembly protein PilN
MRAVNLIPGDGASGPGAGRTTAPGGAYVVLGFLGVLAVFAALWTTTTKQIDERTTKLDQVNTEAQVAEQRAQTSAPYQQFSELARGRKATVTSLSATRFDWAHGLREVARVVPSDVWLTGITGTSGASTAAPETDTSSAPAPQFEMTGCTKSQGDVARLAVGLRAVDGVRSVSLKTSTKPEDVGAEDCPANKSSHPVFDIVIRFALPGETKASVDATGQLGTGAPAPPAASTAAPAAPAGGQPATPPSTGQPQ